MRKNSIRTILLSLLVFSLLFSLSAFTAFAEDAVVIGDEVNVRTGPGTAYAAFTSLKKDTVVNVTNRSNAEWYLVSWDGNSGYVASKFLRLTEEDNASEITVTQEESPGYINGMYVCLRSGPGTSYSILGTYSNGKTLTINGYSGDWVSVTIDGKAGFIYRDYVGVGSVSAAVIVVDDPYGGTPVAGQSSGSGSNGGGTVIVVGGNSDPSPVPSVVPVVTDPTPSPSPSPDVNTEPEPSSDSTAAPPATGTVVVINGSTNAPITTTPAPSASASGDSEESAGTVSDWNGEITGNYVRFRKGPGTTYSIIGTYNSGTKVKILSQSGQWTAVMINGVSGYVFSDYVAYTAAPESTSSETEASGEDSSDSSTVSMTLGLSEPAGSTSSGVKDGYITGNNVRLREGPSSASRILMELSYGTQLKITAVSGSWTKVICGGTEGFVSSDYVAEGTYEPASGISTANGAELGKEIANYALTFVGYRYTWGGNSPATGFDCSGFVQYVFSQFGYTTSRVANDVTGDGVHVDPKDIQPGDVLCFYSSSNYVGHVGIYIGNNTFVHAANSAMGVVTTSLSNNYYASRGYEIRRII